MKNMSFSITTAQMYQGTKDVTRRMGWNSLKTGDQIMAVEKGMGLKKGEKIKRIYPIRIVSVTREPTNAISRADVVREGFPDWTPAQFVEMFCKHNKCQPDTIINRIEFERI